MCTVFFPTNEDRCPCTPKTRKSKETGNLLSWNLTVLVNKWIWLAGRWIYEKREGPNFEGNLRDELSCWDSYVLKEIQAH